MKMLQRCVALPSAQSEALFFAVLSSRGPEDLGPEIFRTRLLETDRKSMDSLDAAGLQEGDSLTASAQQAQVAATQGASKAAFEAILEDGSVVPKGDPE